ncbi:hypothetical protein IW261DRAFT_1632910 [Armillaria novae-zelandiae]|uniref:Uncharacterized protein n=1 Tax=Armillaria novae-zelandiae TaxID=153914 RepID=A0AA39P5K6_9AGAR|nr:hypothetical protein IW261DRAFT_1632910 [Armillaria novae-zelandiae]
MIMDFPPPRPPPLPTPSASNIGMSRVTQLAYGPQTCASTLEVPHGFLYTDCHSASKILDDFLGPRFGGPVASLLAFCEVPMALRMRIGTQDDFHTKISEVDVLGRITPRGGRFGSGLLITPLLRKSDVQNMAVSAFADTEPRRAKWAERRISREKGVDNFRGALRQAIPEVQNTAVSTWKRRTVRPKHISTAKSVKVKAESLEVVAVRRVHIWVERTLL